MARIIWSVICKRIVMDEAAPHMLVAIIDPLDNISLVGPGDPASLKFFNFACRFIATWARSVPEEPEQATARLRYQPPGVEESTASQTFEIDLGGYTRVRTGINLKELPFNGAGRYEFILELETSGGWREVARHMLDVDFAPPKPPPVENPPREI